jgi:hypothetical protein
MKMRLNETIQVSEAGFCGSLRSGRDRAVSFLLRCASKLNDFLSYKAWGLF